MQGTAAGGRSGQEAGRATTRVLKSGLDAAGADYWSSRTWPSIAPSCAAADGRTWPLQLANSVIARPAAQLRPHSAMLALQGLPARAAASIATCTAVRSRPRPRLAARLPPPPSPVPSPALRLPLSPRSRPFSSSRSAQAQPALSSDVDHYRVLEIPKDATRKQIKERFYEVRLTPLDLDPQGDA